jgi:hypothetical protein
MLKQLDYDIKIHPLLMETLFGPKTTEKLKTPYIPILNIHSPLTMRELVVEEIGFSLRSLSSLFQNFSNR